jgi:hypothetical protein
LRKRATVLNRGTHRLQLAGCETEAE